MEKYRELLAKIDEKKTEMQRVVLVLNDAPEAEKFFKLKNDVFAALSDYYNTDAYLVDEQAFAEYDVKITKI